MNDCPSVAKRNVNGHNDVKQVYQFSLSNRTVDVQVQTQFYHQPWLDAGGIDHHDNSHYGQSDHPIWSSKDGRPHNQNTQTLNPNAAPFIPCKSKHVSWNVDATCFVPVGNAQAMFDRGQSPGEGLSGSRVFN